MKKLDTEIIETILRHSTELLNENWQSIAEMLEDTPDGKISVGLAVAIDRSESSPKVKTVISYSRKWKDEREDELDDPNQPRLNLEGASNVSLTIVGENGAQDGETAPPTDVEHGDPTATHEPEPEAPKKGRRTSKVD